MRCRCLRRAFNAPFRPALFSAASANRDFLPRPSGPRLPARALAGISFPVFVKPFFFSRLLLSAAILGTFTRAAIACDSCALYLADGADRPGFTATVAPQFTHLGTVQDGADELPNPVNQYLDSLNTQFVLGYSQGGRWQLQATLPYLVKTYRRPDHADIETGRVSGIGDATLAAQFQVWRQTNVRGDEFEFNVLGGVKFATGDATHLGDELGEEAHHHPEFPESGVHGHDLALGSGSTDYLVGADARWTHGRLFARGSIQYKIRRPGAFDYQLANETSWELGAGGHVVLTHEHSLALQALLSEEHKGLDTLAGEVQDDTGISVRYAGARVHGTIGQRFATDASIELPIRIRTTATMVVPDYRVRAAATWRF
jgi:hypothetical protein